MGWGFTLPVDAMPHRHPVTPLHYIAGFATTALHLGILLTPHTPSWLLFRRAIAFPIVLTCYLWVSYVPIHPFPEDQWSVNALLVACIMRLIDHTFFTPEHTTNRIRPTLITQGHSSSVVYIREDVPPPWTIRKYAWAFSLFFSWRGIGWNFTSPISAKGLAHPYTPTSTRRSFITHQLQVIPVILLIADATKTYMRYPARAFFSGQTAYTDLSMSETVWIHLAVVARVWWILNSAYVPLSIVAVLMGGWLGCEGEFWSPWGWPPIFGGIKEIWQYPGLSTVWSRSWNNGGRRWFEQIGWVGIGEKILRLPRSGISTHPYTQRNATVSSIKEFGPKLKDPTWKYTPATSGNVSPSHPLPTSPTSRTPGWKIALSNFIKSLIVFTLSGLLHDIPAPLLRLNENPATNRLSLGYADFIYTTPFFSIQPLALVVEASIKRTYRRLKLQRGIKRGSEPARLVFVERFVSFVVVWSWLFWCSSWYVAGVGRMRLYVWDGDKQLSLIGRVLWGTWWI